MSDARELPLDPGARRFRRPLVAGLLISALLHAGLALAWRQAAGGAPSPASRSAPPRSDPAPAAEAMRAVQVADPSREPARIPPPPAPVVAADLQLSAPETAEEVGLRTVRLAPAGGEGAPEGAGAPGSGPGEGGTIEPPVPRSVLPEWDPPASVRGDRVRVRVFVDAHGSPAGPVELDPPTSSESFNRTLVRKVRRMEFRPARGPEGPVAAWAELTFVF